MLSGSVVWWGGFHCMNIPQFVCSPGERLSGCLPFRFLQIKHPHTFVYISLCAHMFHLSQVNTWGGTAGSAGKINMCLTIGNWQTFARVVEPFSIATSSVWVWVTPHPYQHLVCVSLFHCSRCGRCVVVSLGSVNLYLLDKPWCCTLFFTCLFTSCLS